MAQVEEKEFDKLSNELTQLLQDPHFDAQKAVELMRKMEQQLTTTLEQACQQHDVSLQELGTFLSNRDNFTPPEQTELKGIVQGIVKIHDMTAKGMRYRSRKDKSRAKLQEHLQRQMQRQLALYRPVQNEGSKGAKSKAKPAAAKKRSMQTKRFWMPMH